MAKFKSCTHDARVKMCVVINRLVFLLKPLNFYFANNNTFTHASSSKIKIIFLCFMWQNKDHILMTQVATFKSYTPASCGKIKS